MVYLKHIRYVGLHVHVKYAVFILKINYYCHSFVRVFLKHLFDTSDRINSTDRKISMSNNNHLLLYALHFISVSIRYMNCKNPLIARCHREEIILTFMISNWLTDRPWKIVEIKLLFGQLPHSRCRELFNTPNHWFDFFIIYRFVKLIYYNIKDTGHANNICPPENLVTILRTLDILLKHS